MKVRYYSEEPDWMNRKLDWTMNVRDIREAERKLAQLRRMLQQYTQITPIKMEVPRNRKKVLPARYPKTHRWL